MLKQLYFFLVCLLWTTVNASRFDVEHALVLYDPELLPLNDTSSLTPEVAQFIEYLSDKFDVKISDYNSEDINLFFDDYPRYEHLVLFPSSKKTITSKEALSLHNLLRFINENSNIFVVGGSQSVLPDGLRGFLNELGVFPSPKNYKYIDHFNSKNGVVQLNRDNVVDRKSVV